MAYGVFRKYPPLYKSPRRRIYTMPRSATPFTLPDPSGVNARGQRKHFYFSDYDGAFMKIFALSGDFIRLDNSTSASGGFLLSSSAGATLHIVAMNDTTWKVQSRQGTWAVT